MVASPPAPPGASPAVPPSARAGARAWWGLPFLLLPALLASMDISILFVASPAITEALAPSATEWLWMMDVYGFVMAGLLITMGALGDRIGRKRLLLIGSGLFGIASVAIAWASTPEEVIAARVLLGVGAATLAPSTLSLIRGMFLDERQRRAAVGAWTVAFTGGAVAGPIVGGVLLEHFWWGSVFLINVPVMGVLLLTVPFLIDESRNPGATRFDLPGAATSFVAILGLVFAAKRLVEHGLDATGCWALAGGLAALALFLRRQRGAAHPLVDLTLFRRPAFGAAVAGQTVVAFSAAGLGLLAFTFLQTVHQLSALRAALWALPTFAGTLVGAVLAAALAARLRPATLLAAGLLLGTVGFLVVGTVGAGSPLTVFIGGYTVLTLGVGVVGTLANTLILTAAPPERAGAAAGISETSNELGAALGIATLGTVASAVYRERVTGVPAAGETVTEALGRAADLPAAEGARLLDFAFAAYSDSVNTAAVAGAGVLAAVAVLAWLALRREPTASNEREKTTC
ncbi:MFS transporter [Streptomyces profundus]|uniref:MFS transporter n=1 Tax=Streptomyces profundus TaxID=2867410 RepID=UPI001D1645E6|nr:MFS transporter [Streptomyces sp. MA3_2.13]UED83372.1 MFS transporter [Streptomyces sp. MA3_2.13]